MLGNHLLGRLASGGSVLQSVLFLVLLYIQNSPVASTLAINAVRHYIDNQKVYAVKTFIEDNNP